MKKIALVFLFISTVFTSCTENVRTKRWGGTQEMSLPKNEILVTITWKENNMWVLSTDTVTGVSHFREHSSWGVMEGEIIVK